MLDHDTGYFCAKQLDYVYYIGMQKLKSQSSEALFSLVIPSPMPPIIIYNDSNTL